MRRALPILIASLLVPASAPARAQNPNIQLAPATIEHRLLEQPLDVSSVRSARPGAASRVQQVLLSYAADSLMLIKWARAADGGSAFNNEPRYEAAAYEIQKLFLDPIDYVVPPTVLRPVPVSWYRQYEETARPTFGGTQSVVLVLQYWLFSVTTEDFHDTDRFESDTTYARYLGNFNILTHLIHHRDENRGNYMISQNPPPRVYAVDNGVAFRSDRSDRGYAWEDIRVDRLPRGTIERVRAITREDLERSLAVIYQYEADGNGELVRVPAGENLDDGRGVRRRDGTVQFGLTRREIDDIWKRVQDLVKRIDEGKIEVFE